uniref:Variant surface glycoprotein 1125.268 n=1 Tax=Trypanosoma brucei TaxID=5691 RepID=A0A1J0R5J8_9TRYP|nr:variant surface glycoprotein 1125.268 [Trypanosoma brucei]
MAVAKVLAIAFAVLFLTVILQKSSATHMGVLKADLDKACDLAIELKDTSAHVQFMLNKQSSDAGHLRDLAEDLEALAQNATAATRTWIVKLAVLTRNQERMTRHVIATRTLAGIKVVAKSATYAGRIDETAKLLLQPKTGSTSMCVSNAAAFGSSNPATANTIKCFSKANAEYDEPDEQPTKKALAVKAKFEAIKEGNAGVTSRGTHCIILHSGAGSGFGTTDAQISLMAGLIKQSTAAGTEPTWKGGHSNLATVGKPFADIETKLSIFNSQITSHEALNTAILKITQDKDGEAEALEIPIGSLGNGQPETALTIPAAEVTSIKKLLFQYREKHEATPLETQRLNFFTKQLEINRTACEIGSKASAAKCQIKQNHTSKINCADFSQEKCEGDCKWDKKDGKCKLTEKAQQQAEKANQETGGTGGKNKDGKKCSDFKTQTECEAADGPKPAGKNKFCGWTGEDASGGDKGFKCRDSSFLLNKKFALSMVSAASVALLF